MTLEHLLLWVLIFALVYVAFMALTIARGTARHSALLWALTYPARPIRMMWNFSVILTDRAWDTLGVPAEQRQALQRMIGDGKYTSRFKGHPEPAWIGRPIRVSYERWGDSLERWTIENSWAREWPEPTRHHEKRVREFLPQVHKAERVDFWGEWEGPHFRIEDGRLLFLNRDEHVSVMPDGALYVKEGAHVLFDIPAPTVSMSHVDLMRDVRGGMSWEESMDPRWRPSPLDQFAAPADPPRIDGLAYSRRHGQEWFQCEDWAKGFCWDLTVNDLRPTLQARVTRVRPSLWSRRVRGIKGIELQLVDSGMKLIANPRVVVAPTANGRTLPQENEEVRVVLNDAGEVDRIWLYDWPVREPEGPTQETGAPGPGGPGRQIGRTCRWTPLGPSTGQPVTAPPSDRATATVAGLVEALRHGHRGEGRMNRRDLLKLGAGALGAVLFGFLGPRVGRVAATVGDETAKAAPVGPWRMIALVESEVGFCGIFRDQETLELRRNAVRFDHHPEVTGSRLDSRAEARKLLKAWCDDLNANWPPDVWRRAAQQYWIYDRHDELMGWHYDDFWKDSDYGGYRALGAGCRISNRPRPSSRPTTSERDNPAGHDR